MMANHRNCNIVPNALIVCVKRFCLKLSTLQNILIQAMCDCLNAKRLPEKDNGDVDVDTVREDAALQQAADHNSGEANWF
jgi:hypothetical protein